MKKKEQTMIKLLIAVKEIIENEGYDYLGINSISRWAQVPGKYKLMMLYYNTGQVDKAKNWAQIIQHSEVKISSETIRTIKSSAMKIINEK